MASTIQPTPDLPTSSPQNLSLLDNLLHDLASPALQLPDKSTPPDNNPRGDTMSSDILTLPAGAAAESAAAAVSKQSPFATNTAHPDFVNIVKNDMPPPPTPSRKKPLPNLKPPIELFPAALLNERNDPLISATSDTGNTKTPARSASVSLPEHLRNVPTGPRAMLREESICLTREQDRDRRRMLGRRAKEKRLRFEEDGVEIDFPLKKRHRSSRFRSPSPARKKHYPHDIYRPSNFHDLRPLTLRPRKAEDSEDDQAVRDATRAKIVERLKRVKSEKTDMMVQIVKKDLGIPEVEGVCWNCLGSGHGFMECLVGCGRCAGDGHRTVYCGCV